MRIAIFCSSRSLIPPQKTGGIEQPTFYAAREIAKRKHDITIYAAKGSKVEGVRIKEISPFVTFSKGKHIETQKRLTTFFNLMALSDFFKKEAHNFDIIHFNSHIFYEVIFFAQFSKIPIIVEINFPLEKIYHYIKEKIPKYPHVYFVSLSHFIKSTMPELNYLEPINPSLDINDFNYSPKHKGYLLFIGRICYDKGVHIAIQAAKKSKMKLIIAGKIFMDESDGYFENFVKPYLSDNIKYVGEVDFKQKKELYENAFATLFPSLWNEPFGIVQIESMACGTPVIAFDKSAAREIIKDGYSGILVKNKSAEEMTLAIKRVKEINRKSVRKWAEKNFSLPNNIDKFEKMYKKIIDSHSKK